MSSLLHRPTPLPSRLRLWLAVAAVLLVSDCPSEVLASRPPMCLRYQIQKPSPATEPDGGTVNADGGALDGGEKMDGGALDGGGKVDGGALDASAPSGDGGAGRLPGSDCSPSQMLPNCVCVQWGYKSSSLFNCAMGRGPTSGPTGLTPFVLYLLFFLRRRLQAAEHRRA